MLFHELQKTRPQHGAKRRWRDLVASDISSTGLGEEWYDLAQERRELVVGVEMQFAMEPALATSPMDQTLDTAVCVVTHFDIREISPDIGTSVMALQWIVGRGHLVI